MREFKVALAIGPADRASAHCDLAESYLLAGRAADAKREALAALEIAPSFERAQDLLLKAIDGGAGAGVQGQAQVAMTTPPTGSRATGVSGLGAASALVWVVTGVLAPDDAGAQNAARVDSAVCRPAVDVRAHPLRRVQAAGALGLRHLRRVLDDRLPGGRAEPVATGQDGHLDSGQRARGRRRSTTRRSSPIPGSTSSSRARGFPRTTRSRFSASSCSAAGR